MVPGMRNNKQLSDYLAGCIRRQGGVVSVEANPLSGRILIRFDSARLNLEEIQTIIRRGVGKCDADRICESIKPVAATTHARAKISSYLHSGPVLYTIATGVALSWLIIKRVLVGRSPFASSRYVCNLGALVTIVAGYPLLRSGVKILAEKKRLNSDLLLFSATLLLLTLRESFTGLAVLWLVYLSNLFQFVMQARSRRAIREVFRKIPPQSGIMDENPVYRPEVIYRPNSRLLPRSELYERRLLIGTAAMSVALLLVTRDIHRSIAVLLAGCPVAVALARNTAQGAAIAASLRKGILVKNARYLEMAAQIDTVVFDKTATPTVEEAVDREIVIVERMLTPGTHSIGCIKGDTSKNIQHLPDFFCIRNGQSGEPSVNMLSIIEKACNDNHKILLVAGRKNDASIMAASHLSVVLGGQGTSATLAAADVIIIENDPSKVADLIQLGRATEQISRQNLYLATGLNLLGVALASSSIITPLSAGLLLNVSTAAVVINSARLLSPFCTGNSHYTDARNHKEETACSYP
ncbi:hypothetical protein SPSIL_029290 [Sporomusa silvacetica DSM 10669]|uniref:Uncharacterized protein n=2 Tax=Sporomusa silvacetica TaxID=55504 RepID=A0ABZ3IM83_9FIRM|nr:copper-exporting P-type ATPase A [Sporomusa silvacetica DSM 10669]